MSTFDAQSPSGYRENRWTHTHTHTNRLSTIPKRQDTSIMAWCIMTSFFLFRRPVSQFAFCFYPFYLHSMNYYSLSFTLKKNKYMRMRRKHVGNATRVLTFDRLVSPPKMNQYACARAYVGVASGLFTPSIQTMLEKKRMVV